MLITNISIALNFVLIIGGILAWFKVPEMILEHYKSHLDKINQEKENEFKQSTQEKQLKFEEYLQFELAEAERKFEQKVALLKKRREILPLIYAKLLELNGVIRGPESEDKRKVQIEVNNFIESNRIFLTDLLYGQIKKVEKSMASLSAIHETMPKLDGGHQVTVDDGKRETYEANIKKQLAGLETDFRTTMFVD